MELESSMPCLEKPEFDALSNTIVIFYFFFLDLRIVAVASNIISTSSVLYV
jgi:hypothetical protein